MKYRLPNLRPTRQQETYDQVTEEIFLALQQLNAEVDAESLWLAMRAAGFPFSQSTFNSRLKLLVNAGRVTKRTIKYNDYVYSVTGTFI